MLLTSIQVDDEDSKPPSLLIPLSHSQLPHTPPLLSLYVREEESNAHAMLHFHEDMIVKICEKNGEHETFEGQIGFRVELEEERLCLFNREDGRGISFVTENQLSLKKCYDHMRIRYAQEGFDRKYELGEKKGSGRKSRVHQIVRKVDEAQFAAKVLTYTSNLPTQIQILRELQHPNLIYFHEFFVERDHTAYIILDYENGGTLLDIIKNEHELTPKRKVKIVTDLLNGLEYLRIKGIVHRDLKPENILFSKTDGNYKIGDFGLATKVNTKFDKIVGTPGYMAPELLRKSSQKVTDMKSDIYSMGLIFYELFTGKQFYSGSSNEEIINRNAKGKTFKEVEEEEMSHYQHELLHKMIRMRKEKRKNSYQILKSSLFNKITKAYGLDYTSSTTSPSKSVNADDDNELPFILAVRQLLKIRSSSN